MWLIMYLSFSDSNSYYHAWMYFLFSPILESESNLKPIWLTELTCSALDSSLLSCISDENIIGFADCQSFDIAAVDCGE